MRWLVVLVLASCVGGDGKRPSLEGPYTCGAYTCESGQVCVTETTGSQCGVNEDAGIGQYEEISWACIDVPEACDGVPSCDCISGPGMCFGPSPDFRELTFGCI